MNNNMLFIPRPTQDQYSQLSCGQCNDLGPTDPIDKIGPRRNREKVRGQIKEYVLTMLGAPVLELELDDQQVENCIDFALQVFEDYAPMEYFQYHTFNTVPGQSVYQMPADVGFIRQISYKETANYAFSGTAHQHIYAEVNSKTTDYINYTVLGGSYISGTLRGYLNGVRLNENS